MAHDVERRLSAEPALALRAEPASGLDASRFDQAQALIDLAERVEAASGPDREIDQDVFCEVDLAPFVEGAFDAYRAPTYTVSLDAAMTLVPEKWRLRQINYSAPCADDRKWHLNLHGGSEGQDTFVGRGVTPALALTAAALRARASIQENHK